jgi:GNAT superfamily N-acetyltransferase
MSFWKSSPGPHWLDFIRTYIPFLEQRTGVIDRNIVNKERPITLPDDCYSIVLTANKSKEICALLRDEYKMFERSRIVLQDERIRMGLLMDEWIGVGVMCASRERLIGCCFSRSIGRVRGEEAGVVDFFCVHKGWRSKGIASFMLQELVHLTASAGRLVHFFMKEGLPVSPLPPIWMSQYVCRQRGLPNETGQHIYLVSSNPPTGLSVYGITNLPRIFKDSRIYGFIYNGHTVIMCLTDLFHRSLPQGWTMGEITWVYAPDVPMDIQQMAVEAMVDHCIYDLVFLDITLPRDTNKPWKEDSIYCWYMFNYQPGKFFSQHPQLTF